MFRKQILRSGLRLTLKKKEIELHRLAAMATVGIIISLHAGRHIELTSCLHPIFSKQYQDQYTFDGTPMNKLLYLVFELTDRLVSGDKVSLDKANFMQKIDTYFFPFFDVFFPLVLAFC